MSGRRYFAEYITDEQMMELLTGTLASDYAILPNGSIVILTKEN